MAAMSDLDHERASDEATAWLIRLREEPGDPTVRAGFEAWRAAAPAHRAAWAEVAQAFDLIGQAVPATESDDEPRPAGRLLSRRVLAGGAIAAVAACLALVFLPGLLLQLNADYATATGEWRELGLADGSAVDLAPRSAITVAMAADRRDVRLLAGQAFFRVTPDAARPFQVQAGDMRATALGTAFDVRLLEGGAGVAVAEGKVRVDYGPSPAGTSRVLQANDWLRVTPAGELLARNEPVGEIGAWRQGQLVAHNRTVADVIDELRPYFSGLIVVASDAVARRRVTGVYELRNPIEALRAVGRAHDDIAVTRVLPWLVVVSGG